MDKIFYTTAISILVIMGILLMLKLLVLRRDREEALKTRAKRGSVNYVYVVSVYDKLKDDLLIHSINDSMDIAQAKALKISDGSIIITKMMRDESDNIYKKLLDTIPKFIKEEDSISDKNHKHLNQG